MTQPEDPREPRWSAEPPPPDHAPVGQRVTRVPAQRGGIDPTFGFLITLALSIGLIPLIPANTDLRYVVAWLAMAGFGVAAWLLGNTARIGRESTENLVWGVTFGLILAAPLLLAGGSTLETTVDLLFRVEIDGQTQQLTAGSVLAMVAFAMPLAETLFFRGFVQQTQPLWLVGIYGSVWSVLLFFPTLDIIGFPVVAVIIGTTLVMMNLIYAYVRQRNGLASAWLCQIVVNLGVLFLPYLA
ncbi:MAG: CPBP family intramembrane metalloprotease [Chloroflexi bacterium]|nr:CPBP family intramembrane metalloprotease [Chloroflexota bacterium]